MLGFVNGARLTRATGNKSSPDNRCRASKLPQVHIRDGQIHVLVTGSLVLLCFAPSTNSLPTYEYNDVSKAADFQGLVLTDAYYRELTLVRQQ